jgi:hypothetical protein
MFLALFDNHYLSEGASSILDPARLHRACAALRPVGWVVRVGPGIRIVCSWLTLPQVVRFVVCWDCVDIDSTIPDFTRGGLALPGIAVKVDTFATMKLTPWVVRVGLGHLPFYKTLTADTTTVACVEKPGMAQPDSSTYTNAATGRNLAHATPPPSNNVGRCAPRGDTPR